MSLDSPRFKQEPRLQQIMDQGRLMKVREINQGVHVLQGALLDLGYSMPRSTAGTVISPDGNFGPETRDTVRALQEEVGISVDGLVGPETMETLDALFPAHRYRVRLHLRAVAANNEPICRVPIHSALEASERVFGRYGIGVDYGSGESVYLSEEQLQLFQQIDTECTWDVTDGDMYDLHRVGTPVPNNEVVVYFVRQFAEDILGCGGHAPDRPACTVSLAGTLWTTAHEVGHVLLTSSFEPVHERHRQNLMYPWAVAVRGVPMLTRDQVQQMRLHRCCEPVGSPSTPVRRVRATPALQFP